MDPTMLVMIGGMERPEEEWRSLLRGAGFDLANVKPTLSPFDPIEAKRV